MIWRERRPSCSRQRRPSSTDSHACAPVGDEPLALHGAQPVKDGTRAKDFWRNAVQLEEIETVQPEALVGFPERGTQILEAVAIGIHVAAARLAGDHDSGDRACGGRRRSGVRCGRPRRRWRCLGTSFRSPRRRERMRSAVSSARGPKSSPPNCQHPSPTSPISNPFLPSVRFFIRGQGWRVRPERSIFRLCGQHG